MPVSAPYGPLRGLPAIPFGPGAARCDGQDPDNHVAAGIDGNVVYLRQRLAGRTRNLAVLRLPGTSPLRATPESIRFALVVRGEAASVQIGGRQVLGPVAIGPGLRTGSAGVLIWHPEPGAAAALVESFRVTAEPAASDRPVKAP